MATIISIGSGKGGVGKSVLSSNLALSLARKNYRVMLVDLDAGGANAHIMFGHFRPEKTLADFMFRRVESLSATATTLTEFSNLQLIAGMGETMYTANLPAGSRRRLIKHIKDLDADYILIDVGAGTNFNTLDYFMMADYNVCVAVPEPTSVLDLYRFVKLGVIRKALSVFLARDQISKTIAKTNIQSVNEILQLAEQSGAEKKQQVLEAINAFQPMLVFNRADPSRKQKYLLQLQQLMAQYAGVNSFPLLGRVPVDPAVEASVRAYQPVVGYAPQSASAMAMAQITAMLLEVSLQHHAEPA